MAYGGAPTFDTNDAVRLLVGDISTSTSAEFLADGDYSYFNATAPNTFIAAQLAANSLAALFAGAASSVQERKVGDLVIKRSQAGPVAKGYQLLSQKYGRMAAAQISPFAGGLSRGGKTAVEGETDRVRPAFLRGLFDNPAAST